MKISLVKNLSLRFLRKCLKTTQQKKVTSIVYNKPSSRNTTHGQGGIFYIRNILNKFRYTLYISIYQYLLYLRTNPSIFFPTSIPRYDVCKHSTVLAEARHTPTATLSAWFPLSRFTRRPAGNTTRGSFCRTRQRMSLGIFAATKAYSIYT